MNDSQTSDRTSSMNITNYFKKSSQPPNSSVTLDGTSSLVQTTGQGTSAEAVPYNFRPKNANESLGSHSRPGFLPKTITTKQVGMSDNIPRKASQWSRGQHTPTPKSSPDITKYLVKLDPAAPAPDALRDTPREPTKTLHEYVMSPDLLSDGTGEEDGGPSNPRPTEVSSYGSSQDSETIVKMKKANVGISPFDQTPQIRKGNTRYSESSGFLPNLIPVARRNLDKSNRSMSPSLLQQVSAPGNKRPQVFSQQADAALASTKLEGHSPPKKMKPDLSTPATEAKPGQELLQVMFYAYIPKKR
jgi:hypothetical protein